MAWVRIHDGALTHPKIVGLIDWRSPFYVWVWGLTYCQQHLTDGVIVKDAVPGLASKAVARLVAKGLWTDEGDAYRVHDYLDWNHSREYVTAERERARTRARSSRERAPHVRRTTSIGVGVGVGSSGEEGVQGEDDPPPPADPVPTDPPPPADPPPPPRGSGRTHGRLFLHRWQVEELINSLGPHAARFELDMWLDGLSTRLDTEGLALVGKDRWAWVQAQLVAELEARGIARATAPRETAAPATPKRAEPRWEEWVCAHEPRCDSRWRCHQRTALDAFKAAEAGAV